MSEFYVANNFYLNKLRQEAYTVVANQPVTHNGREYTRSTYERKLAILERLFKGVVAFVATVTILPLFLNSKKIFKIWDRAYHGVHQKVILIAKRHLAAEQPKKFEMASREEVLALQKDIQITNPELPALNLQRLEKDVYLLPCHKLVVGNATYYCSKATQSFLTGGRPIALGLVKIGEKVYPRMFYLSNSQGIWRMLPIMLKDSLGRLVHWGKGLGEDDTALPMALNVALHQSMTPSVSFSCDCTQIFDVVEKTDKDDEQNCNQAYRDAVSLHEFIPKQETFDPKSLQLPENSDLHPDFSTAIEQNLTLTSYGEVRAKLYSSKDKTLQYLFYELPDGKVFLAGIDQVLEDPINCYGVRSKAYSLNKMDSCLLEYDYLIPKNLRQGSKKSSLFQRQHDKQKYLYNTNHPYTMLYANNWNIVRELEIIKMYYKQQGRDLPAAI